MSVNWSIKKIVPVNGINQKIFVPVNGINQKVVPVNGIKQKVNVQVMESIKNICACPSKSK